MENETDTLIENIPPETKIEKKDQIRKRYKGIDSSLLDVIPAKPKEDIHDPNTIKRVAVYARVSTGDPNQTSSYELQKNHYSDFVKNHEGWDLVDIYADEGISGTSLKHRDAFNRMIKDCKDGKIDIIVTKSVSRFARNIIDSVQTLRDLASLNPPVGVYFETENLFSLNSDSDMILSIMALLAQEESRTKSEIMKMSVEMRFRKGIFLTPKLFGYTLDEDKNLVIYESEAVIVKLMYYLYLFGCTSTMIANILTELCVDTAKQKEKWSPSTVVQILKNERHCGDVLARKTVTESFITHKAIKNDGIENKYFQKNHHEPIISRDIWNAVQNMLRNARYGNKGFLPYLHVMPDGVLKGFITINPRWAGFSADDYYNAFHTVIDDYKPKPEKIEVTVKTGELDMRKFEVAHGYFFDTSNRAILTVSSTELSFNSVSVRKFGKTPFVEILINPESKHIAVRPSTEKIKTAIRWGNVSFEKVYPKKIPGRAYLGAIYEILHWDINYKYKIIGSYKKKGDEHFLLFDMNEPEILIPEAEIINQEDDKNDTDNYSYITTASKKDIIAYPSDWTDGFGTNFYMHENKENISNKGKWNIENEGTSFNPTGIEVKEMDGLKEKITEIISDIKEKNK
ncbi:MAG: recombinase family protein [Lachnospiraceae bacterium]|nr:recombinase family protein [Lachnospiraceae bacterium]